MAHLLRTGIFVVAFLFSLRREFRKVTTGTSQPTGEARDPTRVINVISNVFALRETNILGDGSPGPRNNIPTHSDHDAYYIAGDSNDECPNAIPQEAERMDSVVNIRMNWGKWRRGNRKRNKSRGPTRSPDWYAERYED